ncbi:MAG: ammonium transporter [Polyangiaceae bacterium]|nr:ammonium transporter [Polyangiaceae bacterium]
MFMTPGLALFYGGLVRRKNVLSSIIHSFAALPLVSLQWLVVGYGLAFGTTQGGLFGKPEFFGLAGLSGELHGTIPHLAFCAYQLMFAVITPALIAGAFAERIRFLAYALFVPLWATLVYDPVAHWVWGDGGWLAKLGALDFAGGTVVHLTAGISALVCALVIGKRVGFPHERHVPHNLTMALTGAGILWFGWFGFNAGSSLAADGLASVALINTHFGAAAGAFGWLVIEWIHRGKATALGIASGLVAGLVAITPAAGFVAPWAATVIGATASGVCYLAVLAKERLGYDDSLDAFGIHGVGGLWGALLTGVFSDTAVNPKGADGLIRGRPEQLLAQLASIGAVAVYSALVTFVLLKVLDKLVGLRPKPNDEREGLDAVEHGESGYGW